MKEIPGKAFAQNFYELLEINVGSDEEEIRRAYERIRQIYSVDSLATYGLYSAEELQEFMEHVEQAFRILIDAENRREYDKTLIGEPVKRKKVTYSVKPKREETPPDSAPANSSEESAAPEGTEDAVSSENGDNQPDADGATGPSSFQVSEDATFTGLLLREIRESMGVDLREISETTKVSLTNLRMLEEEVWEKLPALVYVKGIVVQYAKCLKLDPKRVLSDMIDRHNAARDLTKL